MNKVCEHCKKKFKSLRVTQKFCSKSCGNKQHYINNSDKYKLNAKKNRPKQAAKRKAANAHKWFTTCKTCDKKFKKKCQNNIYCSLKCQRITLENKYKNNGKDSQWRKNTYQRRKENPIEYKKFISKQTNYTTNKRRNDELWNISHRLRVRLNIIFKSKNINKNNKTFDLIGCSREELKKHIEKKFICGMNWDNKGKWHIDHIKPLSKAKSKEELLKLCHYSNLQPLWAKDNLKKSNK